MRIFSRIRVLPVTIFAAALMLTVKVSDIWEGFDSDESPIQVSKAGAQQAPADKADEEEKKPAEDEVEKTPQDQEDPAKEGEAKPEGEDQAKEDAVDEDNPDNDPTLFSQTEIDLLQQLAGRREEIERRTREINLREGLMSAAERRINTKIQELRQLESTIQGLIKSHDEQQEGKLQSLVKIYEAMKPKDAARIFEQLELDTLLLVAERMKERKLAPVMAKMNPQKAKDMTVDLSRLRNLPLPGSDSGG